MKFTWHLWTALAIGALVGAVSGYLVGVACASGTLKQYRSELEVIYFISAGPLVLVVLLAGLGQVVLSVRESAKRSRREAAILAINTCEKFGRDFIAVEPRAVATLAQAKLSPPNEWKLLDDLFTWQSFADEPEARNWAQAVQVSFAQHIAATEVVNLLEAMAMAFVHGKADLEIGYHTMGAGFCQSVRRWAPHLVMLRMQQSVAASGPFAATANLYRTWERMRRTYAQ